MSLYKYLSIATLKKIIGDPNQSISGSIRFTQPGAFNDPFELLPELQDSPTLPKDVSLLFDLLSPRRNPPIGELPSTHQSEYCNDNTTRLIREKLDQTVGILCLSRNRDSLLMWSHYADQYAGAMIEFDDSHNFFKGKVDMEYRETRPKKDLSCYLSESRPIPIAEFFIKPKEWEYEAEFRITRLLQNCTKKQNDTEPFPVYVMDIPIETIKSITLGERTSVENQRAIWDLVKDTHIALSLAAASNWDYKFRVEIIKHAGTDPETPLLISPRTAHIFKEYDNELGEIARHQIKNHKHSNMVNRTV